MAIISRVSPVTCQEAQLCMKGTFRVRIHVHNQGLRQQAFDKPSGLEQRLVFHALASESIPHHQIGNDVENGTDGADEYHEAAQIGGIPIYVASGGILHPFGRTESWSAKYRTADFESAGGWGAWAGREGMHWLPLH